MTDAHLDVLAMAAGRDGVYTNGRVFKFYGKAADDALEDLRRRGLVEGDRITDAGRAALKDVA